MYGLRHSILLRSPCVVVRHVVNLGTVILLVRLNTFASMHGTDLYYFPATGYNVIPSFEIG